MPAISRPGRLGYGLIGRTIRSMPDLIFLLAGDGLRTEMISAPYDAEAGLQELRDVVMRRLAIRPDRRTVKMAFVRGSRPGLRWLTS